MSKAKKKTEPKEESVEEVKEKTNAVAVTKPAALPAYMQQAIESEDDGLDEIEEGDIRIPFFKVIQSNAAQLKKQEAEYINGAEQGDFSLHDHHWSGEEGIFIVPVKCRMKYIEWEPQEGGGSKFIAAHTAAIMAEAERIETPEKKYWALKNGNEIIKTADWFVIVYDNVKKTAHQAVLSLKKTSLSAHSDMSTVLKAKKMEMGAPAYMSLFRVTSTYESNEHNSWYGLRLRRLGFHHECAGLGEAGQAFDNLCLSPEEAEKLALTGASMLKGVSAGKVRAEEEAEQEGSAKAAKSSPKVEDELEDEIPF